MALILMDKYVTHTGDETRNSNTWKEADGLMSDQHLTKHTQISEEDTLNTYT